MTYGFADSGKSSPTEGHTCVNRPGPYPLRYRDSSHRTSDRLANSVPPACPEPDGLLGQPWSDVGKY
jgi:hypothetical protein